MLEPVLESVVFDFFINDRGDVTEHPSSQAVSCTTMEDCLIDLDGCGAQQDPDRLQTCGNGNLMKFSTGKSQALQVGSHSLSSAGSSSAERPSGAQAVCLAKETAAPGAGVQADHPAPWHTEAACMSWLPWGRVQPRCLGSLPSEAGLGVGCASSGVDLPGGQAAPSQCLAGRSLCVLGTCEELSSHPGSPEAAPPVPTSQVHPLKPKRAPNNYHILHNQM